MDATSTVEKLRVLLPHWVEHNHNHETEFRKWADAAAAEKQHVLARLLADATASMAATDELLKKALAEVGGPSDAPHHHHHHHHHT